MLHPSLTSTQCHLQLPACNTCLDAGQMCEGNACHSVSVKRTRTSIAKRRPFKEAERPQNTVSWRNSSTVSSTARPTAQGKPVLYYQKTVSDSMYYQPKNAAACEAQLNSTFWEIYMPRQSVQTGCQCSWLQQALDLSEPPPALRLSLKALALARLGWIHQDSTLVINGRVLYGQALQEVQKTLYNDQTMWQDETLATGNVLALYEVGNSTRKLAFNIELNLAVQFLEPTNDSIAGWNNHTNGVTRLVIIRGPERHRSPFGRALLEGIRISAVCMIDVSIVLGLTIRCRWFKRYRIAKRLLWVTTNGVRDHGCRRPRRNLQSEIQFKGYTITVSL